MAVEISDVFSEPTIEAAARLAAESVRRQPALRLDDQVEVAVRRSFCACIVAIEDAIEGGLSGVHAALVEEVGRRARRRLAAGARS
jgi:hypothetical protein